jgi:hypothetical protein
MTTYSLTTTGHVYFTDADTGVRVYLCGARIDYSPQHYSSTSEMSSGCSTSEMSSGCSIKAYYSTDVDKRLTVWQWYTAVCETVPAIDCSLSVPVSIRVGSRGYMTLAGSAPWVLSVGAKKVCMYHPLTADRLGIYWVATSELVTPSDLATL